MTARPRQHLARWVVLAAVLAGCASAEAVERDWQLTVYYTAVESLHPGPPVAVRGCPTIDCSNGDALLGHYPSGFVEAVKNEGTGRITSGPSGRYLNWAAGEGYWLDTAPRDAAGRPLEPFRSAAADGVPAGTRLDILDCGRGSHDGLDQAAVCERLAAGSWEIRDEFTPGFGGDRHADLYFGEEDRPAFMDSPMYATFSGATLRLTPPVRR